MYVYMDVYICMYVCLVCFKAFDDDSDNRLNKKEFSAMLSSLARIGMCVHVCIYACMYVCVCMCVCISIWFVCVII